MTKNYEHFMQLQLTFYIYKGLPHVNTMWECGVVAYSVIIYTFISHIDKIMILTTL